MRRLRETDSGDWLRGTKLQGLEQLLDVTQLKKERAIYYGLVGQVIRAT